MVEKNNELDIILNKNYGKVQQEEIKTVKYLKDKAKVFQSKVSELSKRLEKELKEHTKADKDIKTKFANSLKELKANHASHLKDISNRAKGFEIDQQNALKDSLIKFEEENKLLASQVDVLKTEFDKLNIAVSKQYETDVQNSEKEKSLIEKTAEKDIATLVASLKDAQGKYEALVSNLNEKSSEKLEKLRVTNTKKNEKNSIDIEKEQIKVEKTIADLKPPFDEKLAQVEEKLALEKTKFQKKAAAIKSTLDSKVARHEKFMNKSLKDNDARAVKQHKKEILVLEKNADKELKLLSREHNDRYSGMTEKKVELITNYLNKNASLETSLVKFKEEKLYQIQFNNATLKNDLENEVLATKQTLEDELNQYNELSAENERQQAEVIKNKESNIESQNNIQVNLKDTFEKTNNVNLVKHQEALATKDKEIRMTTIVKDNEEELANHALSVELAKLENEREISEKELLLNMDVNFESELIEYHKSDFNKQSSMNKEYLEYQDDLANLIKEKAKSIAVYEGLEVNNRIKLKIEFLETQLAELAKDYENAIKKSNTVHDAEKAMFDVEIEKLAKDALEDLAKFENESREEIQSITDKRNALNPRAYKKEIRVLDREIQDKQDDFERELANRKAEINSKTYLYNQGVKEASDRLTKTLEQIELLYSNEKSRLESAIELLNRELNEETKNSSERLATTIEDSENYETSAKDRNTLVVEQNSTYLEKRINKEEDCIKDAKSKFENEKHTLSSKLDQELMDFEQTKSNIIANVKSKILNEEEALERMIQTFDSEVNKHNQVLESNNEEQRQLHQSNNSKIDQKNSSELASISKELNKKVEVYKANTVEVDRAINVELQSFDGDKKQAQRDYDAALSKGLSIINQKLHNDLKNI